MRLSRVIETSAAVAATRSRLAKVDELAHTLREAAGVTAREEDRASDDPPPGDTPPADLPPGDRERLVRITADYLAGTLPQRTVGVGYRGLRDLPAPADHPGLEVLEVDELLTRMAALAGPGSAAARSAAVAALFGRATADEQRWLVGLITGELRQGASDGVLLPAVARAADVPETLVRRAVMLAGFTGPVAAAALLHGEEALAEIRLEVGRPLRPMLAGSEPDVPAALTHRRDPGTPVAVDTKVDGIRLQVHLDRAAEVPARLFTRSLDEITDRLPEVVDAILGLPADTAVLDGEVIALDPDGRPHPFQVTGARTASSADPGTLAQRTPVTTFLFDVLHLDGRDLVDEPAHVRWSVLDELAPHLVVPRVVTSAEDEATAFFEQVLAAGHEGVVVKDPDAPYAAGRRGAGWVKVKPRRTADLVVVGVEWGSGRRSGKLSNIHLAARRPGTDELVMVGKTFKGMTDALLEWQTERFLALETHRDGYVVHVRPEQVVEIAYDAVQTSRRYPGGIALRFARVLRYRDDKGPDEADTLDDLR